MKLHSKQRKEPIMKRIVLLIAAVLALIMAGCGAQPKAEAPVISLTLPQGYWIPTENATDKECSIVCAGQRVGGVLKTDLSTDVLVNSDFEAVRAYLGQYVPEGLVYDTMIDGGYPVTADLVLVNPDTMASREFMHYLYEQDGCCYDLWLDFVYLNYRDQVELLIASGIAPDLEYVEQDSEYVPNFENTGLNLGQPNGNTCPIVWEGEVIGGFDYTELAPVVLHREEDFLNMEAYDPSFVQLSCSEFRIRKYMQRHIPEGWSDEYVLMYQDQDYADCSVSMSFKITNPETGEQRQSLHHFMRWDGRIYDSWNYIPDAE